jgi:hypothetical protein
MRRIFVYISSILLCLLLTTVSAQKKKNKPIVVPPDSTVWLNGFTVQADVGSLITSTLMSGDSYSSEAAIQMDLKHRIFPTFELGVAGANKLTPDNIGFKTNGTFERLGVDFNLRKRKIDSKPTNNLFIAGLRIGMSHFNYNVTNVQVTNDYWGGSVPLNYMNQTSSKIWYEIVVGVQVEVLKNVFMGWTIRNKNLISQDIPGVIAPWYIPGFGQNNGSNWGFNYTLGYHFGPKNKYIKSKKVLLNQKQLNKQ